MNTYPRERRKSMTLVRRLKMWGKQNMDTQQTAKMRPNRGKKRKERSNISTGGRGAF